ncbi:RluA family pseudouridine synthase [Candidatus Karelsulcia muelleri]
MYIKPIPLERIYEDEYLLIINKPFNLVVHPGIRNPQGTLVNVINCYLKTKSYQIAFKKPYLANRIDKETSGLIIVVTDENILKLISKQFTLNLIKKNYIALVNGNIEKDNITIYSKIIRKKSHLGISKNKGKVCISSFKVIERFKYITILKCILYTGRTHQLRVHLKQIGNPIFNDKKYGGDQMLGENIPLLKKNLIKKIRTSSNFIALHANSLELIHPIFNKNIKCYAIIPYQIYLLIKIMSTF